MALAGRPAAERPDLILVGRAGRSLTDVAQTDTQASEVVERHFDTLG